MAALSEERMKQVILSRLQVPLASTACKLWMATNYNLQNFHLSIAVSPGWLPHTIPCSEFTLGLPGSGLPACLSTFSDVAVPVKPKLTRLPAEAQSF